MSSIEWTDLTINPLLVRNRSGDLGHYCQKVSPGCANCYAESFNLRNLPTRGTGLPYAQGSRNAIEPVFDRKVLGKLKTFRKPRRVFACSMTDLFLDIWPSEWIQECLDAFAGAADRGHTIQILTKRPWRLVQEVERWSLVAGGPLPRGVWLGFSAEDQQHFDERWSEMRMLHPSAFEGVLWCSYEPALGPIDFEEALQQGLGWVVVGGESGNKARPFDPEWAESVIARGHFHRIPVFVKQMGRRPVGLSLKSRKGSDPSEWPLKLRVREMPAYGVSP